MSEGQRLLADMLRDENEPIGMHEARQRGDYVTLHMLYHEHFDKMPVGHGRLRVVNKRCLACGALLYT